MNDSTSINLIRPTLYRTIPSVLSWVTLILLVHAAIRFGGLSDPLFFPLSMVILWPLPWLLSGKSGRKRIMLRAPSPGHWLISGPILTLVLLTVSSVFAWITFGLSKPNWFVQHAGALSTSLSGMPEDTPFLTRYLIATLPAMLFSPIGEEFLFRGYLQQAFSDRFGVSAGLWIQATAFSLVHLAHFGLRPCQPGLLILFLPSMLAAGLLFGWIRNRSGSLWCAVVSHGAYNAGLNAFVFLFLPDLL